MSFLQNLKGIHKPLLFWGLVVAWGGILPSVSEASSSPGSVSVAWDRNPETNVTGYKVYWGRSSRIYDQVQDAGSSPQAILPNLTAGQPYYCAVTAYSAEGQESAFSAEITVVYGSSTVNPDTSGRLVLLEAENGQLGAPMAVYNGPAESWVDSSNFSQLGWTQLSFDAPVAGDYHVWCRVKAPTESSDSFFVMADGGVEQVFHVYGTPTPADGIRSSEWIWRRVHVTDAGPRTFTFDQGDHSLRFRVREPGALLDRVVLSSDPSFVPSDSLPRSGDVVVVTGISGSQSVAVGTSASFAVTAASTGPVAYQWFKGGSAVPDSNTPILAFGGVAAADAGNYTVGLTVGSVTATAGPMVLAVSGSAAIPGFQVTRFVVNPDRSLSFELEGGLSSNVEIQASGDMVNWEVIGTRVNETGVIEIEDPEAVGGAPRRFYRLVSDAP